MLDYILTNKQSYIKYKVENVLKRFMGRVPLSPKDLGIQRAVFPLSISRLACTRLYFSLTFESRRDYYKANLAKLLVTGPVRILFSHSGLIFMASMSFWSPAKTKAWQFSHFSVKKFPISLYSSTRVFWSS